MSTIQKVNHSLPTDDLPDPVRKRALGYLVSQPNRILCNVDTGHPLIQAVSFQETTLPADEEDPSTVNYNLFPKRKGEGFLMSGEKACTLGQGTFKRVQTGFFLSSRKTSTEKVAIGVTKRGNGEALKSYSREVGLLRSYGDQKRHVMDIMHAEIYKIDEKISGVMCMPLCWKNLYQILKTENSSFYRRFLLLRDADAGLAYLHGKGLYHRDIKPENILVTREWKAYIGDLGAAVKQKELTREIIANYDRVMTRTFIPPGLAFDRLISPDKAREDVWAFGKTCCEMLFVNYDANPLLKKGCISEINGQRAMIQESLDYYKEKKTMVFLFPSEEGSIEERIRFLMRDFLAYKAMDRIEAAQALSVMEEILKDLPPSMPLLPYDRPLRLDEKDFRETWI